MMEILKISSTISRMDALMSERSATIRNVTDIIIKDLQGNYYDINMLYCNGNDEIIIEIKKPNEKYR